MWIRWSTIKQTVLALPLLTLAPIGTGHAVVYQRPVVPVAAAPGSPAGQAGAPASIERDGTVRVVAPSAATFVVQQRFGQPASALPLVGGYAGATAGRTSLDLGLLLNGLATLLILGSLILCLRLAYRLNALGLPGQRHAREAMTAPATQVTSSPVTFTDVAGVEEAKDDLVEIVTFLKAPERYSAIGARIPKGVLLSGPPGTGKTLLARAVAGEAGVPFFSMSGSAFVEMYVGVGAARVRDLFTKARAAAPAVVFIDELDAVGGKRASGPRGGNDEREHTLNQLLVEMDGFDGDSRVVVLAATNRPDMLDPALLRPGRFDRRVTLHLPDRAGRREVLALHAARVRLDAGVDLDALAGHTSGMSPAELANVINEAALLATRDEREHVGQQDLDAAVLRLLAGPELRSRMISPELKRVIAYHEVGHALVMKLLAHCDPVSKVQAIARGNALGITITMPKDDQYLLTESALLERMIGIMGGRAAEELFFGEITTGAQQDIRQANAIARLMVTEYGMSSLGHICVGEGDMVSPALAARIDEATRTLVEKAYAQALDIVAERRIALAAIAEHLCEVETMDGDELDHWLVAHPASDLGDRQADRAQNGHRCRAGVMVHAGRHRP